MPSWARARGRLDSITTSAARTRACKASRPARVSRSSDTEALAALSRSKNSAGPRRAPSGRRADSTLITSIPARASNCPHNGPAQSDERSTTRTPRSVAVGGAGADCGGDHGTAIVAALAERADRQAELGGVVDELHRRALRHRRGDVGPRVVVSRRRRSTPAGVRGRRRRGSATATQPSAVGSSRVEPPQLTSPLRRRPASAARSPSSAGPSTATASPTVAVDVPSCSAAALEHPDDPSGRAERRTGGSAGEPHPATACPPLC